jgi:hypothetical protein
MILHLHDNLFIYQVQEKFSKCFPHLKIEFYSKAHHVKEESLEKDRIDPQRRIGEVRQNQNAGWLDIKSWDTIARIEKAFKDRFGLNVQVFRKENNTWVQTSKTDRFTIRQQMMMAEGADRTMVPKFNEQLGEYDYL